jgi:steroid delta-isomerase-like uncharacterized protein
MSAKENLAVHAAWTAAEDEHDLSRHEEFLHPDIELHLPGGEVVNGLAAYRAVTDAVLSAMPDCRVILDDVFATDDRVVCRWRLRGTHAGELYGYAPSGKVIEYPGISLWEFEDGRARRGWSMPDLATAMTALGG